MPYPFGSPSPEAQVARRKIGKVHSTAQKEALSAVLSYVEGIEERLDRRDEEEAREAELDRDYGRERE